MSISVDTATVLEAKGIENVRALCMAIPGLSRGVFQSDQDRMNPTNQTIRRYALPPILRV